MKDPTQAEALSLLSYDEDSGLLTWKDRPLSLFKNTHRQRVWNAKYSGKIAGSLNKSGYIELRIFNRLYRAHRITWLRVHGEFAS